MIDSPCGVVAGGPITGGPNTVSGCIFWNRGAVPDGSLLIALTPTSPASPPLVAEQLIDDAIVPRSYELREVPPGVYFLMAFLDVDRDSSWDVPGLGDFFAITEDAIELSPEEDRVIGINVELR